MNELASHLVLLRDPRLAALATASTPAWLWSTDATRILWANPVGATIFGDLSPAEVPARRFDPRGQVATQITRLLGTLRFGGAPRLERLRGIGTGIGRALTCRCSRLALPDHTAGVLIVAMEPAGPALTLTERLRRLYDGSGLAVAAFAPDGNLIHATPPASARLGGGATLATLGATQLGVDAVARGHAEGEIALGRVTIERVGVDATMVLVAILPPEAVVAPAVPPMPMAATEPLPLPEQPPHEVVAPPTVPAMPAAPEAPPVAPDSPDRTIDSSAARPAHKPLATPETAPAAPAPATHLDMAVVERRHPLRFVWQMDADGRFTLGSDEFTEVIGPRVAVALGRAWQEINAELALDPENQVERAVATHDTWSGITVSWPVDGCAERLKVELAGLPIYDRNRSFLGYRGFGVCRDIDRLATLAVMRRTAHATAQPAPSAGAVATPQTANAPVDTRPTLTLVPTARNVVPFRSAAPAAETKSPGLSPVERSAFHELARQLTARLKGDPSHDAGAAGEQRQMPPASIAATPATSADAIASVEAAPIMRAEPAHAASLPTTDGAVEPLANAATAVALPEPAPQEQAERPLLDRLPLGILVYRSDTLLYANRAFLDWTGYPHLDALAEAGGLDSLFVESGAEHEAASGDSGKTLSIATPHGEKRPVEARLFSIPWGGETALVLMFATTAGREGALKSTEAALKASEMSLQAAKTTLQATQASLRRAEAQARELKTVLDTATDAAEKASAAKSDFLAKISHEIRTPLNAIIGFSEVMLEERFGPIGNERYRDYLKDIRGAGDHVVALINDLLDLAKIEAGRLDLVFTDLNLNELVQAAVAQMQPQANRERIIIRTSLAPALRPVVVDARAVRQIALNVLSNSIKFTGAGGQVIVSTAPADNGDVLLRVRDTGIGMDEKELGVALEPFRQFATTARWGAGGTGLGLPLTKALAEANRARFTISSKINDGTLVEIAFPATHVRAN